MLGDDIDNYVREWEFNLLKLISEDKYDEIKNLVNKEQINFNIRIGKKSGDNSNIDEFYYNLENFNLKSDFKDTLQDIARKNAKNNALKGLIELEGKKSDENKISDKSDEISENIVNSISGLESNPSFFNPSNSNPSNSITINNLEPTPKIYTTNTKEITTEIVYIDGLKHINGWSSVNSKQLNKVQWKLKYNRVINNFYYFNLKDKESFWSWAIIVISSFTGLVTLGNNISDEPFYGYHTGIKILLTMCTSIITLIAAWIKKQQYVERINNVDRYLQKLNKLCEELDIQLILTPVDRIPYNKFREINLPLITEYLATNPLISPTEWKECVYQITKHYPEIIAPDNIDENKLWPWFGISERGGIEYRPVTKFGEIVLATYGRMHRKSCHKKYLCCCFYKHDDKSIFKDIYNNIESSEKNIRMFKKGDKIKVIDKKPLRYISKSKRKKYIQRGLEGTVKSVNIIDNKLFYNVAFDSPSLNTNRHIPNEYHNSKIELKRIVIEK